MFRYALLFFLGLTACQADETISGYTNSGDVWQLVEMNGTPIDIPVTLSFPEEGKLAGRAPCNRYFGSQTAPLPWFEIGPIASTKMACKDLAMEQEYFQTLSEVTLAEPSKTTLILSNDQGVLLRYKLQ